MWARVCGRPRRLHNQRPTFAYRQRAPHTRARRKILILQRLRPSLL